MKCPYCKAGPYYNWISYPLAPPVKSDGETITISALITDKHSRTFDFLFQTCPECEELFCALRITDARKPFNNQEKKRFISDIAISRMQSLFESIQKPKSRYAESERSSMVQVYPLSQVLDLSDDLVEPYRQIYAEAVHTMSKSPNLASVGFGLLVEMVLEKRYGERGTLDSLLKKHGSDIDKLQPGLSLLLQDLVKSCRHFGSHVWSSQRVPVTPEECDGCMQAVNLLLEKTVISEEKERKLLSQAAKAKEKFEQRNHQRSKGISNA